MSFSYLSGRSQTKILGACRQVSISSVLIDTTKIHRLLPTGLAQKLCVRIAHGTHSNENDSGLGRYRNIDDNVGGHIDW